MCKAFQLIAFITFLIRGIKQFVVQITYRPIVFPDMGVHPIDGIITLFIIHHKKVILKDGFQNS